MEQRLPLGPSSALGALPALGRSVWLGLATGVAVLLAVYVGLGIGFIRALPAPALELGLSEGQQTWPVDSPLVVQTIGWGTSVENVRLVEFPLDEQGNVVGQRDVVVQYQPITEGSLPGETRGRLVREDGRPLLALDSWYELTVAAEGKELTLNGVRPVPLVAFRAFGTPRTPSPRFDAGNAVRYGQPLAIGWNEPIAEFRYTVTPEVPTHSWVSDDGLTAYIALDEFEQGASFEVQVTDARTVLGTPLQAPAASAFTTAPALRVTGFSPENGERDVAPGFDPIITFSAPIENPEAAKDAIVVEPATDGTFRWLAPNRVQFVTDKGFPYSHDVELTVKAGPEGLRSEAGGYLDDEATLAYRTRVRKEIDVNLSRQTVTLLEDGKVVYTTVASTGVKRADTPTGHYTIQYKMPKTRMRGTNPDGHSYDIPDVPWVMPFLGDYTFHGAPWRQAWGVPLSNGCVSMPTANAKFVYDWTPVGTPVNIHY
jgi:lipoprotein-anchoring transpeptidase ErfK/SrfK